MLKSTLTALLLSSVAIVPATTISVLATTDAAYAKSNNAGGNGNGGGNKGGSSANAKSKDKSTASRGGSGPGKARNRSGSDPVGNFIRKLTGQEKKKTTRSKSKSSAPQVAKAPKAREKDAMHPSNLGNMNGALNANVNAVAAHIRNGNTNGPVGHLAALAVATADAAGAQDIVDADAKHQNLDDLLGDQTVEDYLAQRNGVTDPLVEEAITNLDGLTEEDEGYVDAVTALNDALGDRTLEEYEAAREGDGGNEDIDNAIAALGGNAEEGIAPTDERPSEEEVAKAEGDLEGQYDAQKNILTYWNKNPDTNPDEISEEEQALLDKLNERLEADKDAIDAAIADTKTDEDGETVDGETVDCETDDGCEPVEDEDVAIVTE